MTTQKNTTLLCDFQLFFFLLNTAPLNPLSPEIIYTERDMLASTPTRSQEKGRWTKEKRRRKGRR